MSRTKSADRRGQELHDRATRGHNLSPAERAELEAWYRSQDAAEARELGVPAPPDSLTELRRQVEEATAELRRASERLHQLSTENEALRQEIAALQRRLERAPLAPAS